MDFILKIGDKEIEGISSIEYEEESMNGGLVQTEYYMKRRNNYYFRNKFGNATITSDDKNFIGALVYGQKYDIEFTGLRLISINGL